MGNFYKSHLYQYYFSLMSTVIKTARRNCENRKFEPEVEVLKKIIKPESICIDIGGAYARYAFPLSKMVGPKGKVYSFEPGSYSYGVFWWIKFLFNLRNVVITKKAVSDSPGQIQLCLPLKASGKLGPSLAYINTQKEENNYCETVERITLDDFNKEAKLPRLDFMKCDTEGSELLAFRGAKGLIERFRPLVLAEVDANNMNRYQLKPSDIVKFFTDLNYRLMVWENDQFVLKSSADVSSNYFFVPEHMKL